MKEFCKANNSDIKCNMDTKQTTQTSGGEHVYEVCFAAVERKKANPKPKLKTQPTRNEFSDTTIEKKISWQGLKKS